MVVPALTMLAWVTRSWVVDADAKTLLVPRDERSALRLTPPAVEDFAGFLFCGTLFGTLLGKEDGELAVPRR